MTTKLYSRADIRTAVSDGLDLAADEANMSEYDDRFAWAATSVMTLLDEPSAQWADVKNHHYRTAPAEAPTDDAPLFTRKQVAQAIAKGVDLAAQHQGGRHAPDDLDNLVVNAALTLLDDPDADFHTIAIESYDESPRRVRSWL
ncbi:hypothetical protein OG413_20545 [Streptomyces sp. NBC_01433]|uniref:hypothetical protein n=1 Tax=Streptomyces sp. NBC_01433 TaxID=2903864 RepID=UPI0022582EF4|nr:hypothetical protein [Streptomyces sp. NBC_01433]MCX4677664.1 hypothetical protein [Streptomyces sp. NBC_01433]